MGHIGHMGGMHEIRDGAWQSPTMEVAGAEPPRAACGTLIPSTPYYMVVSILARGSLHSSTTCSTFSGVSSRGLVPSD